MLDYRPWRPRELRHRYQRSVLVWKVEALLNPDRADLVLVSGNPVEDIKATRLVKRAWLDGAEIVVGN